MSGVLPRSLRRPSWPALTWFGVLVLALVAGAVLAANSDVNNTDVRTASALPSESPTPLGEQLRALWSSDDAVDDQRVVAGNTVITATGRGVRGLDARTGAERWHYLRSNATMCDFTVLADVVVAIFRTSGRCNEAVALEADSGVRRWYRNVDFSEQLSLLGSGTAALAATPGGIAVLDAVGNSLRWRYNPPEGCELSSIGIGSSGVVVLERCETGTTWLAEFELDSGEQQWRVPPPPGDITVLGADGIVSLLVGQQLMILSARTGETLSTVVTDAESDESAAAAFASQPGGRGIPLVYVSGRVFAFDPSTGEQLWSVAATGPPAAGDAGLVVPEPGAFVVRNPLTGQEISRSMVSGDIPEGLLRAERFRSGLLALTEDGITAYG
ncbi:MAG: PQQ-like beta-propeller repeat protein [Actinomycetota bacterium]|nr:PQQ-like beta-propeller repeat protein [Actinomycetota bacterium]